MKKLHVIAYTDAELHAVIEVPDKLSDKETLKYIENHVDSICFGEPILDFKDIEYDYYYVKA